MRCLPLLILTAFCSAETLAAEGGSVYESGVVPLLRQFCYDCHGGEKPKGGVELESATAAPLLVKNPDQWVNVLRVLRDRTMPPGEKPQPTLEQREQAAKALRQTLDTLEYPLDPGRSPPRRLTAVEYNNTLRDLLGVTSRPADRFPADAGGGEGFDNNASTLYLSPILMEQYLDAAEQAARDADPRRLFVARPDGKTTPRQAAQRIVEHLLPLAFRRPVSKEETQRYTAVAERSLKAGGSFENSVRLAVKAALVSPYFLYRTEADQPAAHGPYPVGDFELASRLSYFLWSSMPDETLFDLAQRGKLRDPAVLKAQTLRMLDDPKSRELAEQFAGQWLDIRRIQSAERDAARFPQFTPELRRAMHEEAITFFDAVVRDNRSLLDLVDSRYVYVNEPLARHYGIAGVAGPAFRRVELNDPNRGGVVTLGAVLTLTSYPQRTSPVLRGKWVLEQLLGTPAPPPPMNVKTLPPDDAPRGGMTFRQRMEKHRADAQCAACHARLDPPGFGLENFDPIGQWRTQIGGVPVDASGQMTGGQAFTGPAELKKLLLERKEDFLRNLARKMLGYALGRGVEPADAPTIRATLRALEKNGYAGRTLIVEIVNSHPFRHRRNGETPDHAQ